MVQRIALGIALVIGLLLFCAVCLVIVSATMFSHSSVGGSLPAGATLPTGRSISASADSWNIGLETSGDSATIRTAGRTILVAPTRVFVDGRFVAPIAAAAKAIEVKVNDGQVDVIADGIAVERDPGGEAIDE